jgi:hypothetical protein
MTAIKIDPAAAGAFRGKGHQGQCDQTVDDGPDQDLVGDALGQKFRRRHKGAAEREGRVIGQGWDKGR